MTLGVNVTVKGHQKLIVTKDIVYPIEFIFYFDEMSETDIAQLPKNQHGFIKMLAQNIGCE